MRVLTRRAASIVLFALGLALAQASPGAAQSGRGGCTLTVLELWFGEYDVFEATPTRATTRIQIQCRGATSKIRPTVELSAGSSQNFARRTQVSGGDMLSYNIYADAGLTQIAGDGSSGTRALVLEDNGSGGTEVTLYGAIDPRQFAPPGVYFDTVYVTLIF